MQVCEAQTFVVSNCKVLVVWSTASCSHHLLLTFLSHFFVSCTCMYVCVPFVICLNSIWVTSCHLGIAKTVINTIYSTHLYVYWSVTYNISVCVCWPHVRNVLYVLSVNRNDWPLSVVAFIVSGLIYDCNAKKLDSRQGKTSCKLFNIPLIYYTTNRIQFVSIRHLLVWFIYICI